MNDHGFRIDDDIRRQGRAAFVRKYGLGTGLVCGVLFGALRTEWQELSARPLATLGEFVFLSVAFGAPFGYFLVRRLWKKDPRNREDSNSR